MLSGSVRACIQHKSVKTRLRYAFLSGCASSLANDPASHPWRRLVGRCCRPRPPSRSGRLAHPKACPPSRTGRRQPARQPLPFRRLRVQAVRHPPVRRASRRAPPRLIARHRHAHPVQRASLRSRNPLRLRLQPDQTGVSQPAGSAPACWGTRWFKRQYTQLDPPEQSGQASIT